MMYELTQVVTYQLKLRRNNIITVELKVSFQMMNNLFTKLLIRFYALHLKLSKVKR